MRGQAHTLEATIAGLLMLASLIFALQMTAASPLAASSGQQVQNQQEASAQGVLAAADNADALKPAVLYWDETEDVYHDSDGTYNSGPPDNRFGDILNQSFNERGIAYNVNFMYQKSDGSTAKDQYIYSGEPSDGAVVATRTVTLYLYDHLYDKDENPTGSEVRNAPDYAIEDSSTGNDVYNTVQVEVVVWRL